MMTNEKQKIIRNSVSYKLVHAIALWIGPALVGSIDWSGVARLR